VAERVELRHSRYDGLPFLNETFDIVLSNLLTIVALPDALKLSRHQSHRIFKQLFGATPRTGLKVPGAAEANGLGDVQCWNEDLNSADSLRGNFDPVLCC